MFDSTSKHWKYCHCDPNVIETLIKLSRESALTNGNSKISGQRDYRQRFINRISNN